MNGDVLFAAIPIGDFIEILVIIFVVLGSALAKLIGSARQAQRPGGPQRPNIPQRTMTPRQPNQPTMQQPVPAQRPQRPKSITDEIDDFLRKTQGQKRPGMSGQEPRPLVSQQSQRRERPRLPSQKLQEPVEAETVSERPVGGVVNEHVKKFLDEKEFSQRASKLGGDVAAADEKIEKHLHDVFGHGISQIAAKPGETSVAPLPQPTGFFEDEPLVMSTAGISVASLLTNPANLCQAIIINEILQRPVDRWK